MLLNFYFDWHYSFNTPKYYYLKAYVRFYNDYAVLISPKVPSQPIFDKRKKNNELYFKEYILSESNSFYLNSWRYRIMLIYGISIDSVKFLEVVKNILETNVT